MHPIQQPGSVTLDSIRANSNGAEQNVVANVQYYIRNGLTSLLAPDVMPWYNQIQNPDAFIQTPQTGPHNGTPTSLPMAPANPALDTPAPSVAANLPVTAPITPSPVPAPAPNYTPPTPVTPPPQTPVTSLPAPTTALQPGMTGTAVKSLQDYLVSLGLMTAAQVATGPGVYGPQTTAAVAALQQKLGVDNSSGVGFYGPKTMAALSSAGINAGSTPVMTSPQAQLGADQSLLAKAQAAGYGPNDSIQVDASGNVLPPGSTTTQPSTLQSILATAGINAGPTTSLTDIVSQLSQAYGLNDIKTQLDDLNAKYVEKVANINDDPWITEGVRVKEVAKQQASFDLEKQALMSELSAENTVVGQAITLYNAQQSNQEKLVSDALTNSIQQITAQNGSQTPDIKNYNLAVSQGYTGTFNDFLKEQANLKIPSTTVPGSGRTTVGAKPPVGSPAAVTAADISSGQNLLDQARGEDGWTDPSLYIQMSQKWVNSHGTIAGFVKAYPPKLYINPANTWVPAWASTAPKTTASPTSVPVT